MAPSRKKKFAIGIFFLAAIFVAAVLLFPKKKTFTLNENAPAAVVSDLKGILANQTNSQDPPQNIAAFGAPEISGWIAWWEETDGYAVVAKHGDNLSCVSPGWLKLDKNENLVETGEIDKQAAAQQIKDAHLMLYPMLTTDLTDQQLSTFMKDEKALDSFVENLTNKLKDYGADGLDLDFENIGSPYLNDFSLLTKKLGEQMKKNNLKFSVAVQAQTGKDDWNGLKGQDIKLISEYADEVRLMIYDRHGQFSEPGPITPMDWFAAVIEYNLGLIPREKLVIGLPTYGYIWQENGKFQSLQFKDFVAYADSRNLSASRDPESFELKYTVGKTTGWLSDSAAVIHKMEYARKIGLNRFVIWNLGGTDEDLFKKNW